MTALEIRSRRGRPPALSAAEREARILDGLEAMIVDQGLGAVTMDGVARMAGMSKRTLYSVFGNRSALFAALVRRTRANYVRPLTAEERALPLEARLRRLFSVPGDVEQMTRQSAAFRAMIAGAGTDSELAGIVLREGLAASRAIVREEIERAARAGEIGVADADLASRMLLDMAYDPSFEWVADPDYRMPAPEDMQARIRFAVGTFVRGVAL